MRDSSSRQADRSALARPGAGASAADVGAPGKRTLVEGLGEAPAAGPVQRQANDHGGDPTYGDTAYDGKVTAIIQTLVAGYQGLHISVPAAATSTGPASALTVTVSTPYYNNKYEDYDASKKADDVTNPQPSVDFDRTARTAAEKALGALDSAGTSTGNAQAAQWGGKGSPGELVAILDRAVAPPLSAVQPAGDANDPAVWKAAIEKWMRTVGLGVDCNGLVYEALLLMRDGKIGAEGASKKYSGGDPVSNILRTVVTDGTQDHRTLASIDELRARGISITDPSDLRPGDVMVRGIEHVRIVERIEHYDANATPRTVTFRTAEANVARPKVDGVLEQDWSWALGGDPQRVDADGKPMPGTAEVSVFQRHLVDPAVK